MDEERLKTMFPKGSRQFFDLNRQSSGAITQSTVQGGADGQTKGKEKNSGRIIISIGTRRQRLLDPDNACPKYFIDGLRYAGLIPNDRPEDIELKIEPQKKVEKICQEKTLIKIQYPSCRG